jgi:FixJ family two-component response regulator
MTRETETLPTVFVVDDDAAVRKSLERLLRSEGYRSESFASADGFLERWRPDPAPGCLVLDVEMPGLDGLQLQQALHLSGAAIPIIFITGHGDIPRSVKAMKAGALDFLTKPVRDEDLFKAIQQAFSWDRRQRAERAERDAVAERFAALTPREREVLMLVVRGLLNKQIAFELGASEKTIKIHRGRVMQKMRVPSVADLVRAAQKLGLQPDVSQPPA